MATYHLSAKIGAKGKGCAHSDYIERVGKNAKHEDLEHAENGNMPTWAHGKSATFWKAADEFERENGSVYRELEIALPRELTPAQRLELVREFISQEIGSKHAYSFAIHCPQAALDPNKGEQPHAHIMYSERLIDGIERPADQYFKRYNANNPEKGGAKKLSGGKHMMSMKDELREQRERWANLQNQHLAKYGHAARVDHRTLEEQGIKRDPSKHLPHLGVAAIAIVNKGKHSYRKGMLDTHVKSLHQAEVYRGVETKADIEARREKSAAYSKLHARQSKERTALFLQCKKERELALQGDWKGRGAKRNSIRSVLTTKHAALKVALAETHAAERKQLWQGKHREEQASLTGQYVQPLSKVIQGFTYFSDERGHTTFFSNGEKYFRDEGSSLKVLNTKSDEVIAAALSVSMQKFGKVLTVSGAEEFKNRVIAESVKRNLPLEFSDPIMEAERQKLQQTKHQHRNTPNADACLQVKRELVQAQSKRTQKALDMAVRLEVVMNKREARLKEILNNPTPSNQALALRCAQRLKAAERRTVNVEKQAKAEVAKKWAAQHVQARNPELYKKAMEGQQIELQNRQNAPSVSIPVKRSN